MTMITPSSKLTLTKGNKSWYQFLEFSKILTFFLDGRKEV